MSVSFDDGDQWQSLRLNMPATSIRDLVIKDADLVVGTHGRGFWILDDISPLRQITPSVTASAAYLFRPPVAWRFRWNKNTDTPLPPDEPAMPNPPDGVTVNYFLGPDVKGPVTLEIVEVDGPVVRRYSSDDPEPPPVDAPNLPDYWIRPTQRLAATPGLHRFVWDVRYPPPVTSFRYAIVAIRSNTPRSPHGVWVLPGTYQVRLTVGGQVYRQAVTVRMDPRVQTTMGDLTLQFTLSRTVNDLISQLAALRPGASPERLAQIQQAYAPLPALLRALQSADARPTIAQEAAVAVALERVRLLLM